MINKCIGCYHYDSICTHGSPIFLDGTCTDYQDNEFVKQIRANEREKISDELSEVQQILILYDVDTAEKKREIIDLLEQIKSPK